MSDDKKQQEFRKWRIILVGIINDNDYNRASSKRLEINKKSTLNISRIS